MESTYDKYRREHRTMRQIREFARNTSAIVTTITPRTGPDESIRLERNPKTGEITIRIRPRHGEG